MVTRGAARHVASEAVAQQVEILGGLRGGDVLGCTDDETHWDVDVVHHRGGLLAPLPLGSEIAGQIGEDGFLRAVGGAGIRRAASQVRSR